MMKEFKISYNELMMTPYHVVLEINFIEDTRRNYKHLQKLKAEEAKK